MKAVAVSDTHLIDDYRDMPEADVLFHTGDGTGRGRVHEIIELNRWFGEKKKKHGYRHIIFVPGNHDWLFQTDPAHARMLMSNATVLIDESITIDGIEIYGTPWQPEFFDWAFNLPRGGDELRAIWAAIPETTRVLLTHSPPHGILDTVMEFVPKYAEHRAIHVGCELLRERIEELHGGALTHHSFGHLHDGYGKTKLYGIDFCNASICDERYRAVNEPHVLEIV